MFDTAVGMREGKQLAQGHVATKDRTSCSLQAEVEPGMHPHEKKRKWGKGVERREAARDRAKGQQGQPGLQGQSRAHPAGPSGVWVSAEIHANRSRGSSARSVPAPRPTG